MNLPVMSCDKLVVIGREAPHLEFMLNSSLAVVSHGIARMPYKYYYTFTDGSFLQIAERKNGAKASVRYEFNPNKCIDEIAFSVLGAMIFERFSRIDIAIDYKEDLSLFRWFYSISKSKRYFLDKANRLETLYIGSPESNLMHRIYNKAKERLDSGEAYKGFWWRLEAVCKFDKEQMLHPWFNPFEGLVGVLDDDLSIDSWEENAKVQYLLSHPQLFAQLNAKTKKKYKNLIISSSKHLEPSPEDVYKQENDKLFAQLAKFENVCLKKLVV